MHHHIVLPVSLAHATLAQKKLAVARRLIADGGKITLLTVLEDVPGYVSEFVDLKPANHLSQKIKGKLDELAGDAPDLATEVISGKAGVRVPE